MYDKDQVKDSLDFCKDIENYYKASEDNPTKDPLAYFRKQLDYMETLPAEPLEYSKEIQLTLVQRIKKRVFSLCSLLVIALVLAWFITTFIGEHTKVEGISMEHTLRDGDYLIIDKLTYQFHSPKRFDIIIFPYDDDTNYIKRIIGMPGEAVQIIDGVVYINRKPLEDPYGQEIILYAGRFSEEVLIGANEYFVLGDNRNKSTDSRQNSIGLIKRGRIIGRAYFRLFPLDSMGSLNKEQDKNHENHKRN